ncbi:MAG: cysteine hydrolase [Methanolinea sp.]|jgi:nicotinamidase-related amidase|nr:cysteine hydrolase [Methanolinea sp.]
MQRNATSPPIQPALLIIDMQNDFVQPGGPLRVADTPSIIPKVKDLLNHFRERKLPVFHILRVHRASGVDVEITRREIFQRTPFAVEGTTGAGVIPALTPMEGEYIVKKTRMSAFFQTDLDLMLRTLGVDTLFVAGIQTPNCIRMTVFDGMALNYRVFLVCDAVAAQTDSIHRANVEDMQNIGIGIMKCGEVLSLL